MTVPETMVVSVLTEPKKIELQRASVPKPGPNQVLMRVTAIGVCGSDTHFYETGAIGDIIVDGPIVLGHETAGEIVAVGENVDASRLGAHVAIEPQMPCRRCSYCKAGSYHLCRSMKFYGAYPIDGSFSEYVLIDDDFAHEVPQGMTPEQAALVEPVSVAVHACRRAGVVPGSKVLITGAGPIGVLNAQVAIAFGATEVVVSDPIVHRREYAAAHGVTAVLDPATADLTEYDQYFDVYIDASANARAITSAFPTIRPGGSAVLVGMGGDFLEVPIAMIQHREIMLTGTYRYVNTWPTAIDLIATGRVEVASLVTGRYGLEDVAEALMRAKTDPLAIKTMIIPELTKVSQ